MFDHYWSKIVIMMKELLLLGHRPRQPATSTKQKKLGRIKLDGRLWETISSGELGRPS